MTARRLLVVVLVLVALALSAGCSQPVDGYDSYNGVRTHNGVPQCEYGRDAWTGECY